MAAALLLAGCGGETIRVVDRADLERSIAGDLQRQTAESPTVRCPDDVTPRTGTIFRCTLRLDDGSASAVRVTLLDDDGRFRFELLRGR